MVDDPASSETMLQLVKTTGGYNGVEYNNPGPAHLSAGQKAAVGMAYMPDINDFYFRITAATVKFSPRVCARSNCCWTTRASRRS